MLYLILNFFSLNLRDVIYGFWGLIKVSEGAKLLESDYNKLTVEV